MHRGSGQDGVPTIEMDEERARLFRGYRFRFQYRPSYVVERDGYPGQEWFVA